MGRAETFALQLTYNTSKKQRSCHFLSNQQEVEDQIRMFYKIIWNFICELLVNLIPLTQHQAISLYFPLADGYWE